MASAGIIVLAEDDPRLRRLYTDALTATGFHVFAAADGLKTLALLNQMTPRVIILDIMMPRLNGIETCKRARGIVGYDIPIIFLSTHDQLDVLRECVTAGGDDYIIKSDSMQSIVERIRQWSVKGGRGQLAERRKQMLVDFASQLNHPEAARVSEMVLRSDNDEVVRAISVFVAKARAAAGADFGKTDAEKLRLIGYVTGAIEYWAEAKGTLDKSFHDYLRGVLQETGLLIKREMLELARAPGVSSTDKNFAVGRQQGHKDSANQHDQGLGYVPIGLATSPPAPCAAK